MYDVEEAGGALRFVGLQMPDQVEARPRQFREVGALALEFPHVVLAEIAQARFIGSAHCGGGEHLGHRNEGDLLAAPSSAADGRLDPPFDLFDARAQHDSMVTV